MSCYTLHALHWSNLCPVFLWTEFWTEINFQSHQVRENCAGCEVDNFVVGKSLNLVRKNQLKRGV